MNKVELKITKKPVALCGEAMAVPSEEGAVSSPGGDPFIHASAPGVFLDVFPYRGHVICELFPETIGRCDYQPNTRLDVECRKYADNISLLVNLRDAIDAALALNEYLERDKNE